MLKTTVDWRVHTPNLLREIMSNPGTSVLRSPLRVFAELLAAVGERAAELDDPKLNALMMQLTIYEVADPDSPKYDPKLVTSIIEASKDVTNVTFFM